MLTVNNTLSSYTLAAGEPFVMEVQLLDSAGRGVDINDEAMFLTFYTAASRAIVSDYTRNPAQYEGERFSDDTGEYFRWAFDGRFSEGMYRLSGVRVELAQRLRFGRKIIATGVLIVGSSAISVPSLPSEQISDYAIRVTIKAGAMLGAPPTLTVGAVVFEGDTNMPPPAPVFTSQPSIAGTPRVGQALSSLTYTDGVVENGSVIGRTYLLNGAPKPISYVLTDTDIGAPLVYRNTATGGLVMASSVAVTVQAAGSVQYPAPLTDFTMGYNVRKTTYYEPIPLLSNWGKYVSIKADAPGSTPHSIFIPYAGITGTHTITTDVPTTLTTHHATVQIGTTGGTTHVLTVTADATDTVQRYIEWTGSTKPAWLRVEPPAGQPRINPQWVAAVTRGKLLRNLDMVAQNNVPFTGQAVRPLASDLYYEKYGVPYYPYQDIADGIAAAAAAQPGFGFWKVIDVDLTDADVLAQATYERDTVPTTSPIYLQFGNETEWNTQFSGVLRLYLDGLRNGWYGADTTLTTPKTGINPAFAGEGGGGNTASPATPAGGYVLFNYYGIGYSVWRAKQNVPAGTAIADNAYWTRDTDKDARLAATRWHVVRFKQMLDIYKSVFGAERFAAQLRPVVMAQAVIGELYNQISIFRTFDPDFWSMIWGSGYAFYFGEEDGYNYTAATPANIEASIRARMAQVINSLNQMVVDNAAMGKKNALYEGMTHPNPDRYDDTQQFRGAWNTLFASEAGRVLMADIAYEVRRAVGVGVACGYDLLAGGKWSLLNTFSDTQNKRLIGWETGLTADYTPTATIYNTPYNSSKLISQVAGVQTLADSLDNRLSALGG